MTGLYNRAVETAHGLLHIGSVRYIAYRLALGESPVLTRLPTAGLEYFFCCLEFNP